MLLRGWGALGSYARYACIFIKCNANVQGVQEVKDRKRKAAWSHAEDKKLKLDVAGPDGLGASLRLGPEAELRPAFLR